MRADAENLKSQITEGLALLRAHLDWDVALRRLEELNAKSEDPALWAKADAAQALMRERNRLAAQIEGVQKLERDVADALELIELAEAEGDAAIADAAVADMQRFAAEVKHREIESLLSGEADSNDAYLEVNAGAGGTEAQDWAEMLLRMYSRWAEKRGYKIALTEQSEGEQAGIKSATLQVTGPNAFGWLKTETGVHRLVRISPFDAAARRQTSFASVYVYPVIDDRIEIEINPADLKTDTFRASGAGGQHVNKTESGVRFTHIPTGVVAASTQDRSQHKNRAIAMEMLKARLYELELRKREAISDAVEAGKTDIGWGHQIRSYVLQPYQMVKDLRTGVEKGNPDAVLDGEIDDFMAAALALRVGTTRSEASAKAS
ncbi:peptide chain release factor 2 [Falsiroseomonas selenitidurans]|uniref:Peptide chain release factor 2 n=1 Tax=Falsiroseomonas selenitidurans TaxID=2716335 RepID=A0ABX1EC58_9PROT|nr:peptide chain release factor 2 [Falsiroseomonas selenitidurans]NKC34438.1 peptide chain release factor 2 [Falsiroseomonas selenitidurans]OYW10586.1 MAG: peptide chain release factor 2 [Rhodospirillales bacterium 12-71-4]